MKIKYGSDPIFKKLSWAIAYHLASQEDPKFYRQCGDEATFMFDLLNEDGNDPKPAPEFQVIETFELDGDSYGRFEIEGNLYWRHIKRV